MTGATARAAETAHVTPDLSGWEDKPRVPRSDTAPVLSVDGFAGPLDWLLEMARARKINLAKLSIGALIGQFADALAVALAGRDTGRLDRRAGWTVMAATLTELRSRLRAHVLLCMLSMAPASLSTASAPCSPISPH